MNKNVPSKTQDMGSGSIPKLLAQLAIPAVVAQIINLLYNIVDRIYIGHIPEIGASALTGVGLFMPILMLINAFAMLAGSGGAPRAAIAMGKKNHDTAEKIVQRSYPSLCCGLCKNLHTGKCFCTYCYGYESIYYHTRICKNQYADNSHRSCH